MPKGPVSVDTSPFVVAAQTSERSTYCRMPPLR